MIRRGTGLGTADTDDGPRCPSVALLCGLLANFADNREECCVSAAARGRTGAETTLLNLPLALAAAVCGPGPPAANCAVPGKVTWKVETDTGVGTTA